VWRDLENAAPELAQLVRERLAVGVALLGTIRKDGSPRISPVEPFLVGGHLVFGAMAWSLKARDLARDSRCVLHSAVSDPDPTEGEAKLYGRAVGLDDDVLRNAPENAWWVSRPAEDAHVFSLAVEEAAFLTWDRERGLMTARRWSPERGYREVERPYP
jgi:Pyridoxamine 5'-phosphate oxidase